MLADISTKCADGTLHAAAGERPWILRFCSGHFREWLRPSGVFVVLLGPDGSGKTTTSEALRCARWPGSFPKPLLSRQFWDTAADA
jgi:hypothetical protein